MKASEMDAVHAMVRSVRAKIGQWLTHDSKIEHAIYWVDEETGVRCKCRPDFLCQKPGFALTLDLKTTTDVTPAEFQRKVETMGYWMQDAHYSAGVKSVTGLDPMFLFVAVENEWPFDCAAFEIHPNNRSQARLARALQPRIDLALELRVILVTKPDPIDRFGRTEALQLEHLQRFERLPQLGSGRVEMDTLCAEVLERRLG